MVIITHNRFNAAVATIKKSLTELIEDKLTSGKKPTPSRRDIEQILAPALFDGESHNVVIDKLKSTPKTATGLALGQGDDTLLDLESLLDNLSYGVKRYIHFERDLRRLQDLHIRALDRSHLLSLPKDFENIVADMIVKAHKEESFVVQGVTLSFSGLENVIAKDWLNRTHSVDFEYMSEVGAFKVVEAHWVIGDGISYCESIKRIELEGVDISKSFDTLEQHHIEKFIKRTLLPLLMDLETDVDLPNLPRIRPETLAMLIEDAKNIGKETSHGS